MVVPTIFPAFLKSALRLHAEANAALSKPDVEPLWQSVRPKRSVHNVDAALSDVVDATLCKHGLGHFHGVQRVNGFANGPADHLQEHVQEDEPDDDAVRSKYVRSGKRVAHASGSGTVYVVGSGLERYAAN